MHTQKMSDTEGKLESRRKINVALLRFFEARDRRKCWKYVGVFVILAELCQVQSEMRVGVSEFLDIDLSICSCHDERHAQLQKLCEEGSVLLYILYKEYL